MTDFDRERERRLTFAIISHPDAGKTTITEKLLLFGGAIHIAGAVKSKKSSRGTVSDFMKMEQERGISVSTSVMGFDYAGRRVNLLDTPGHADFSEDTYRTLTAVDSGLMVIDSVKGVEERTRSLAQVCRMRTTPLVTFLNKMDREGRPPIELLDQVEAELDITVCPRSWPIGQGKDFRGVYKIAEDRVVLFRPHETDIDETARTIEGLDNPELDAEVGSLAARLREDVELIREVYPDYDREHYLAGQLTPVFFGSALNNFGVRELLDFFAAESPPPLPRKAAEREVQPEEDTFSGVVFKIHANLDPRHRDRIAYLRICSGVFRRNKLYLHVRSGKQFKSANPTAFMAQERTVIDEAYPGDIIGLHDNGTLRIGDTLTEGEHLQFIGIPRFAPTIFVKVINKDPMKSKQLNKGLDQLAEEGVAQVFSRAQGSDRIIGVVGQLQLDVIKHRLEHEYKALCIFEPVDFSKAAWVSCSRKDRLDAFIGKYSHRIVYDRSGHPVYLAENQFLLDRRREDDSDIDFRWTADVHGSAGASL
ncbi:MAG: peptide chain release factor 3 [Spirochaetaceae bacterium]|nr:MAG: peptide chain release factor 3 [Spirochaetaceae bacterium]